MKHWKRCVAWFTAGAMAACLCTGCESSLGSGDGEIPIAVGRGRIRVDSLGMTLEAPPGWSASLTQSQSGYLALVRDSFAVFQPSLTVVAEAYPYDADLGAVLRALEESKSSQTGSDAIIASRDTVTLDGVTAGVLEYGLRAAGLELRARQFVFLRAGRLILVTCMDGREGFPDRDGEFDAIMASLRFD